MLFAINKWRKNIEWKDSERGMKEEGRMNLLHKMY